MLQSNKCQPGVATRSSESVLMFCMRSYAPFIVSAIFCSILVAPSNQAGQVSAIDLFHRMQQALGGAEKIAAIYDLDWTVKADTFDQAGKSIGQVTKRTRWIRPNYLRLDQTGPGDTYVLYFDGDRGWEVLPESNKTIDLTGGELDFARKYLAGFMLNLWIADRAENFSISSPAPNVIRISSGTNSNEVRLSPSTWLPAQVVEWQEIGGVHFPAHEINSHPNDGSADIRTQKIAFNAGLKPEELRAKPLDGKPVLRRR
jgi:hypothetical protein